MTTVPRYVDLEVGDRITFRAATRWADRKVTRVVTGFLLGRPTVCYGGHSNFMVREAEVTAVAGIELE